MRSPQENYAFIRRRTAELLPAAQSGDSEAFDEVIRVNDGLVKRVVRRFLKLPYANEVSFEPEDLLQIGRIGLLKSVYRFDLERGTRFNAYASILIKGEIQRYARDHGFTLRPEIRTYENFGRIIRTQEEFIKESAKEPSYEELAELAEREIGIVRDVMDFLRNGFMPDSLDRPIGYVQDGDRLGDFIPDRTAEDPAETVLDSIEKIEILDFLAKKLSPQERRVLQLRFGLVDGIPRALGSIRRELRLSHASIRKLEARALDKLKLHFSVLHHGQNRESPSETEGNIDFPNGAGTEQRGHARKEGKKAVRQSTTGSPNSKRSTGYSMQQQVQASSGYKYEGENAVESRVSSDSPDHGQNGLKTGGLGRTKSKTATRADSGAQTIMETAEDIISGVKEPRKKVSSKPKERTKIETAQPPQPGEVTLAQMIKDGATAQEILTVLDELKLEMLEDDTKLNTQKQKLNRQHRQSRKSALIVLAEAIGFDEETKQMLLYSLQVIDSKPDLYDEELLKQALLTLGNHCSTLLVPGTARAGLNEKERLVLGVVFKRGKNLATLSRLLNTGLNELNMYLSSGLEKIAIAHRYVK